KEKARKIENSELPEPEKQKQINRLLTEHSEELEKMDKLIYDERNHFRQIRNKLIDKLCEDCLICSERERILTERGKVVKSLESQAFNLSIFSGITFLFFVLSFLLLYFDKKKSKKI